MNQPSALSPGLVFTLAIIYFAVLFIISLITGKDKSDDSFFVGGKKSPWFLVAFGMIGASLSGITFISVPGAVGGAQFGYMQMVFGYLLGYAVIALLLMPIYYRLNLTSIYTYLEERLGFFSYKTGAAFFLISRTIGAALRLYLVASVLDYAIFSHWNIPFFVTVFVTIALIWLYTFRGGIRTIVFTDSLQTFFMLLSLILTVIFISQQLKFDGGVWETIQNSNYSQLFFWDILPGNNFFKQFLSGAFIAIVMTGLDQDMMQKNLSCRNLKEAQLNMGTFSIILLIVNFIFLVLGALLFLYKDQLGIQMPFRMVNNVAKPATDLLFPAIALSHSTLLIGSVFFIGLLAAAYSSADSALTSLTTTFCVDFLNFKKGKSSFKTRTIVHVAFSFVLFFAVLIYNALGNDALIWDVFKAAMYTYGPILGLFAFGIFTRLKISKDIEFLVIPVCILSVLISYFLNWITGANIGGFQFGFLILPINGFITFAGLCVLSLVKTE